MKLITPLKLRLSMRCLRLGVYDYLGFARQVLRKMDNNPYFVLPEPSLALIADELDHLQRLADDALDGARNPRIARNMSLHTSRMQLRQLISYVELTGKNDPVILTSSGFELRKPVAPIGELLAPQNLRARYNGNPGQAVLLMSPVHGVRAGYTFEQAENPAGPWLNRWTASYVRLQTVLGLISGKTYYWRARANGAAGPGAWSTVVGIMAP